MNQVAFILKGTTVYWYPVILALAVLAGICFFMACCQHSGISAACSAGVVLVGVVLSVLLSRLLFWYSRADSFQTVAQALTTPDSGSFALTGTFAGCVLAGLLLGKTSGNLWKLFDCMSIAGCASLALGRLGNFFTSADRGQIMTEMTGLPWAYPVVNAASGVPEYRFATFLFQAILAGVMFCVLLYFFLCDHEKHPLHPGDTTLLFLLVYSASQVILDSTRYDSLYFRSNGFVSVVQVVCAILLAGAIVLVSVRAVKAQGLKKWMILGWTVIAGLLGVAGYMEYFVQRHGRLALFAYTVMEHCMVGIVVIAICFWRQSRREKPRQERVHAVSSEQ